MQVLLCGAVVNGIIYLLVLVAGAAQWYRADRYECRAVGGRVLRGDTQFVRVVSNRPCIAHYWCRSDIGLAGSCAGWCGGSWGVHPVRNPSGQQLGRAGAVGGRIGLVSIAGNLFGWCKQNLEI